MLLTMMMVMSVVFMTTVYLLSESLSSIWTDLFARYLVDPHALNTTHEAILRTNRVPMKRTVVLDEYQRRASGDTDFLSDSDPHSL
jgi:hypothetical protein